MSHPDGSVAAPPVDAAAAAVDVVDVVVVENDDRRHHRGGDDEDGGGRRDRDPHAVHVKSEYVASERPSCLAAPPPPPPPSSSSSSADKNDAGGGGGGSGGGKNDRNNHRRGTNKKRPRDVRTNDIDRACQSIIRGETCPYQLSSGGCKYNHDLKGMLANRPGDIHEGDDGATWLEGMCPSWIDRG
jgi:hypothetical protein